MPRLELHRAATLLRSVPGAPPSDAELLDRFAASRDESAFTDLVARHWGLVYGTARRHLGDAHAAEDVCQAAFLVLARKAGGGRWGATVGPWLHVTAVRLARKARRARRAQAMPPSAGVAGGTGPDASAVWGEVCRAVDEELAALPEPLRGPLVLCYLEGRTRDETAGALGCSLAMLKRRLERGRNLLRDRLARRGVGLPAGGLGVLAADLATGAAEATARAVVGYARTGRPPAAVAVLLGSRAGWAPALGLAAALVACGVGLGMAAAPPEEKSLAPVSTAPPPRPADARADAFGDPLPAGAMVRLGTTQHRAPGAHVAVTPDGKTVVTVGNDLVVRTFDPVTGDTREVRTLDGPPAYQTALSADGRYLAGMVYPGRNDKAELWVWDLATGKPAGQLALGAVPALVWDGATGTPIAKAPLGETPIAALCVHAGTKRVSFVRASRKTCVWSFAAVGEPVELREFTSSAPFSNVPRTLFSPDGSMLLAHQRDGHLTCWDLSARKVLWDKSLPHLKFFLFTPDGKRVIVQNDTINAGFEVWSTTDGKPVKGARWGGTGDSDQDQHGPVAASADGRLIDLVNRHRQVVLLDTVKKVIVRKLDDPLRVPDKDAFTGEAVPTNFAFTPDGTGFVCGTPTVQRWDVATGKSTWPATWDRGHTEAVTRLRFTPDGNAVVSAAADAMCYVWNLRTGRPQHRLPIGSSSLTAVTPNGRTLITSGRSGTHILKGWDLKSGKETLAIGGKQEFSLYGSSGRGQAAVTTDGKQLVTLSAGGAGNAQLPFGYYLAVWDLATQKLVQEEFSRTCNSMTVLAPGGAVYATVPQDEPDVDIHLVATATGKNVGRLNSPSLRDAWPCIVALKFSPDGRLLAARANETSTRQPAGNSPLKVWDVTTAQELASFPVEGPAVFEFAPDGRTLVIAGTSGFRAVEVATRREIRTVAAVGVPRGRKPGAFATALAVGSGGRTVITGHIDGTILVWDAAPRAATGAFEAGAVWKALAAPDAAFGRAAVLQLVDAPDRALELLEKNLSGVPAAEAAGLVRQLDAEAFGMREGAEKALRALGSRAEPALAAALAGKPSAELRSRAERLRAALAPAAVPGDEDLRDVRAVEALEQIGTAAARKLLTQLATGAPGVRLTREAKAALARLTGR
ncbi:ECF RNA polymerase sigma factor SigE [Gemmata obscuriglobus]|uniref:Uncharacterized protein n=1 Tax=Gemmata obscuriglobus TaxID=114 RepID=A0A2Z3HB04_9BACT|nr:sigma-70 family RNA polymerase sigma factor [Gemmata obscuriglobus]AWM38390.1 hypothetical protein C1280_16260 [Gemmata obscuriglobus]QEG28690.1 ECF RNA polymerase sigma factor SigE [Gemmata obscuriglobus]VTS06944.1 wd40 repeat-containing protein : Uncultured bacterium genome assembly Metasoil_fosmids_resub OS=uncultured bacterium PE=4 SV=1: Sigma70_r2: Sigma70_r4_2: WD40 [Gemmata obscuriglobus UQM 2246]